MLSRHGTYVLNAKQAHHHLRKVLGLNRIYTIFRVQEIKEPHHHARIINQPICDFRLLSGENLRSNMRVLKLQSRLGILICIVWNFRLFEAACDQLLRMGRALQIVIFTQQQWP